MTRALLPILIAFVLVGCSTPRPAQQADKVRSGEETAKAAADAAREAAKKNDTGLIVASSQRDEDTQTATTQPTSMPTDPAPPMTATLRVEFVQGTLTQAGEPIVDFEKVCAEAVAAQPDITLILDTDPQTEHAKVIAAIDTAKAAGIKKFSLHVTDDDADAIEGARASIYSEPPGIIVVDGKETGKTTPATVPLAPGKHDLQVKFPSGLSKAKTIDVAEGTRVKLFFREDKDMEKQPKPKKGEKKDAK